MPTRHAFTIAETAVATFASATLVVGLGSALSLAGRALPTAAEPAVRLAEAARALDRMAADTAVCTAYQVALDRSRFQALVPDQDGDGSADVVVYLIEPVAGRDALIRRGPAGDRVLAWDAEAFDVVALTNDLRRRRLRFQLTLAGAPSVTAVSSVELLVPDNTP